MIDKNKQMGFLMNPYRFGAAPPPPVLSVLSIIPSSGSELGGTPVTITGTLFVNGATVTIAGVSATSVVWVNSTTITAVTAAGSIGTGDVVVTNPDLHIGTLVNGYHYGPLTDLFVGKWTFAGSYNLSSVTETSPGAAGIVYTDMNGTQSGPNYVGGPVSVGSILKIQVSNPTQVTGIILDGDSMISDIPLPSNYLVPFTGLTNLDLFADNTYGDWPVGSATTLTTNTALQTIFIGGFTGLLPSIAGLTALTSFTANNCIFSNKIPDLSSNTSLVSFSTQFTELHGWESTTGNPNLLYMSIGPDPTISGSVPAITGYSSLVSMGYFRCPLITGWTSPSFPPSLTDVGFNECSLTTAAIDLILAAAVASGETGYHSLTFAYGDNQVPSPTGFANIATLTSRGWNINYNSSIVRFDIVQDTTTLGGITYVGFAAADSGIGAIGSVTNNHLISWAAGLTPWKFYTQQNPGDPFATSIVLGLQGPSGVPSHGGFSKIKFYDSTNTPQTLNITSFTNVPGNNAWEMVIPIPSPSYDWLHAGMGTGVELII